MLYIDCYQRTEQASVLDLNLWLECVIYDNEHFKKWARQQFERRVGIWQRG